MYITKKVKDIEKIKNHFIFQLMSTLYVYTNINISLHKRYIAELINLKNTFNSHNVWKHSNI
jgi:hypothetical protein